jgi:hypothetical protein
VDQDGKSSLLSLVKAFDSVLDIYEGFCNLKQVRLFTSGFLFFSYFTSSKPTLFILPLNIYNIPHISLFILHYILLKYYKTIIIIFFSTFPPYFTPAKQNQTSQPHTVHAGETKPNIPTTYSELNLHHSHKTITKSNHPSKLPLNLPQTKPPTIKAETHRRPKPIADPNPPPFKSKPTTI